MGEPVDPKHTPEQKALMKGDPLIGLGAYQAVMEWEWWKPLRLRDRLKVQKTNIGVSVKEKSAFSGRTVHETRAFYYKNQDNDLCAVQRGTWIRAERHKSAEKKKGGRPQRSAPGSAGGKPVGHHDLTRQRHRAPAHARPEAR